MGTSFTVGGTVRDDFGTRVPGISVDIYVDGSYVTGATTDINGNYSRNIFISTIGYHTLRAQIRSGEGAGVYAERGITITYTPVADSISVYAPSGAETGESFTIYGYVADQYGNPYYSGPVTITVAGQTHTVYGNSTTGYYSKSTSIAVAGTYTIRASAGSVSATDSIQIVAPPPPPPPPPPDPTPTTMTLVASKTNVAPGEVFTLTATLKTAGGTPLAYRIISITLDGNPWLEGQTDTGGQASADVSINAVGVHTIQASYAGE